jgi:hypothetical protein
MARFGKSHPIELTEENLVAIMQLRQEAKDVREQIAILEKMRPDGSGIQYHGLDSENERYAPIYIPLDYACIDAIISIKQKEVDEILMSIQTKYGVVIKDAPPCRTSNEEQLRVA